MQNSLFERYRIVVDAGQVSVRLDKFLGSRLPCVSRNRIQAGIRESSVLVNEKPVKPSYRIQPHDTIQVFLPTPPRTDHVAGEAIPIAIIYEDDDLLVVNKEAPMVVHPAHENWTGTLVNALVYHCDGLPSTASNQTRPGLVHRLDKGTSGLLVVAKHEDSLANLAYQFMQHTVSREYQALVWGDVRQNQGTIDIPIGRSAQDRRVMVPYSPEAGIGKQAVTHYEVVERLGYVTLVRCKLETGRTHQIRAHMKHLGHPLFGDPRYGGDRVVVGQRTSKYVSFVRNSLSTLPYQALHAKTLGFIHPKTKMLLSFQAPLPQGFQDVLNRWRVYTTAQSRDANKNNTQ
ncbi:MAG: RluA family pseudouridine synthase [Bacteroidota bacterium]